jgi:Flp pilus assembly protein TadD
LRKSGPRDPHAPLGFVFAHPGTSWGHHALAVAAMLKGLTAEEVAAAFRACFDASRTDPDTLNDLAYHALAAHQYDEALLIAQALVRQQRRAETLDTLAEVYYYRHEPLMAQTLGERAVALEPDSKTLRANLERFRRADGTARAEVEAARANGLAWLPDFYGEQR